MAARARRASSRRSKVEPPRRIRDEAPLNVILVQPQLGTEPDRSNFDRIQALLDWQRLSFSEDDVLLLPEHFDMRVGRAEYENGVRDLARRYGCHVVGGSHHELRAAPGHSPSEQQLNRGVVASPDGSIVGQYEKLRPYAGERDRVRPGKSLGEVTIAGRRVLILICADFWFSDLFALASELPDIVLVPALSVTRKPSPEYSRTLWRHLAVARAYEFGTFVGISDWAHPSALPALFTSGVGGFVDPTRTDPAVLFSPIPDTGVGIFRLDFAALDDFRRDRLIRGFFWKS